MKLTVEQRLARARVNVKRMARLLTKAGLNYVRAELRLQRLERIAQTPPEVRSERARKAVATRKSKPRKSSAIRAINLKED